MSVSSEFQRVLGDCHGLLQRAVGPGDPLVRSLIRAGRLGASDLPGAAEQVLAALDAEPGPSFASDLEREEFAQVREHLSSICRVILGR